MAFTTPLPLTADALATFERSLSPACPHLAVSRHLAGALGSPLLAPVDEDIPWPPTAASLACEESEHATSMLRARTASPELEHSGRADSREQRVHNTDGDEYAHEQRRNEDLFEDRVPSYLQVQRYQRRLDKPARVSGVAEPAQQKRGRSASLGSDGEVAQHDEKHDTGDAHHDKKRKGGAIDINPAAGKRGEHVGSGRLTIRPAYVVAGRVLADNPGPRGLPDLCHTDLSFLNKRASSGQPRMGQDGSALTACDLAAAERQLDEVLPIRTRSRASHVELSPSTDESPFRFVARSPSSTDDRGDLIDEFEASIGFPLASPPPYISPPRTPLSYGRWGLASATPASVASFWVYEPQRISPLPSALAYGQSYYAPAAPVSVGSLPEHEDEVEIEVESELQAWHAHSLERYANLMGRTVTYQWPNHYDALAQHDFAPARPSYPSPDDQPNFGYDHIEESGHAGSASELDERFLSPHEESDIEREMAYDQPIDEACFADENGSEAGEPDYGRDQDMIGEPAPAFGQPVDGAWPAEHPACFCESRGTPRWQPQTPLPLMATMTIMVREDTRVEEDEEETQSYSATEVADVDDDADATAFEPLGALVSTPDVYESDLGRAVLPGYIERGHFPPIFFPQEPSPLRAMSPFGLD